MSLDLVDFKRNNWGLYIFIAIVVLAIIFLPDLIGNKKERPVAEVEQSEVEEKAEPVKEEEIEEEEVEVYVDPLAIKGDKKDEVEIVEEVKEETVYENEEVQSPSGSETNKVDEGSSPVPQPTSQPLLKLNSVSWQNLHEGAVVDVLKDLKGRSEKLAASLPSIFEDSRYSLYNYIAGVDYLLGNNERNLSALNALLYLEFLDKEVTKTFIKERVSRGYFVEWAHISLTTLLGKNSAETFKLMAQPDFNPAILLTDVEAEVPIRGVRNTNPTNRISVFKFDGMVVGNDVAVVEVFRNGELLKKFEVRKAGSLRDANNRNGKKVTLSFYKKDDEEKKTQRVSAEDVSDDIFNFEITRAKVDGFYTIKVTNIEGLTAIKTYKFDNIYSVRRWKFDGEKNTIVFSYKKTPKHQTRVDDVFRLVKREHTSSDGFIIGGDNSGFKSY